MDADQKKHQPGGVVGGSGGGSGRTSEGQTEKVLLVFLGWFFPP